MKRKTGILSLILPLCLLLGCGGSGAAKNDSATASSMTTEAYAADDADYGWEKAAGAVDSAAQEESAVIAEGAGSQEVSDAAAQDAANRKLIKTVSLDLQTKEFDTLKQNLEKEIENCGGYVESSNYYIPQGEYQYRYYNLTVRIPAEKLDSFVKTAGNLGTLTDKSENVEDVTLNYVDMTAYKESLQIEYERVTEILKEATELDQILALESKLSELRYEINSYESQLRTYDNLISYSTVHIYISEVEVVKDITPTVGSRIRNGFRESLNTVKNFFVDLFVWIVSHLPELLVAAVCIAILAVLVKKIAKKMKRRRAEKMKAAGGHQDSGQPLHQSVYQEGHWTQEAEELQQQEQDIHENDSQETEKQGE